MNAAEQVRLLTDAVYHALGIAHYLGYGPHKPARMADALEAGLKMSGLPIRRTPAEDDRYEG